MDLLTETSWKRYESTSARIFFTETIFFTQNSWNTSLGGFGTLRTTPLQPVYRKKGEEVAAQLAQASWVASSRSNPASKILWKAQFQNCYLHPPIFDKFTPFFRNLRKSYGSLTKAYRTWISSFFSSFSPILSEIFLFRVMGILRKHYGSPKSLESHF